VGKCDILEDDQTIIRNVLSLRIGTGRMKSDMHRLMLNLEAHPGGGCLATRGKHSNLICNMFFEYITTTMPAKISLEPYFLPGMNGIFFLEIMQMFA